jgi:hypothetical protein
MFLPITDCSKQGNYMYIFVKKYGVRESEVTISLRLIYYARQWWRVTYASSYVKDIGTSV